MGNTDTYEALRRYVIDRRLALGLSQYELAQRCGIGASTIGNLEGGTRPSIPKQDTIAALARGLDVPYWLLDRIARGIPADAKIPEDDILVILSESDPEIRAMLYEIAAAPADKRRALLAAMAAALAVLRKG